MLGCQTASALDTRATFTPPRLCAYLRIVRVAEIVGSEKKVETLLPVLDGMMKNGW